MSQSKPFFTKAASVRVFKGNREREKYSRSWECAQFSVLCPLLQITRKAPSGLMAELQINVSRDGFVPGITHNELTTYTFKEKSGHSRAPPLPGTLRKMTRQITILHSTDHLTKRRLGRIQWMAPVEGLCPHLLGIFHRHGWNRSLVAIAVG